MITNLSDLYPRISQQLPGVSASVLDNEFRKAERIACRECSIWNQDFTFITLADTYEYAVALPANTDLVYIKEMQNVDENTVSMADYVALFQGSTSGDGYTIDEITTGTPTGIAGDYTDSGETLNGQTVYTDASDTYALYKAVEGMDEASSLYILSTKVEYDLFVSDELDKKVNGKDCSDFKTRIGKESDEHRKNISDIKE